MIYCGNNAPPTNNFLTIVRMILIFKPFEQKISYTSLKFFSPLMNGVNVVGMAAQYPGNSVGITSEWQGYAGRRRYA